MADQAPKPPRHHLLIAGTGRAGTSFLVRWLAAAGLRTHLATHATPQWHEDANAGLEDLLTAIDWEAAPYVVKSPWFVEVIDDVLANPRVVLDGVIIPVRDLAEAAASRVVHERHAAHRGNPWMTGLGRSFEQWGTTPGGVVYSLDPVDQARLLAVSFHRLVQRLVKADIPVVFLDFPRLALDAEYLFRKLRRFVPATITQALAAHAEIADPKKIRVGGELGALREAPAPEAGCEAHDLLDAVALRREVRRLLDQLAEAERSATAQREEVAGLRNALDVRAVDLAGLAPAPAASDADRQASEAQIATLIATVEQRRAETELAAAAQREAMAGLRGAFEAQAVELAGLVAMLEARNADWQAAQAQIATLTAMAEERRAEADRSTAAQQAVAADLRGALDARTSELAGLLAMLAARDATLAERDATLAARGTALAAQEAALAVQDAALVERAAALATRDTELEHARAQVASLMATAEQGRADTERAEMQQQSAVTVLRNALDARSADLAGLTATLEARDADLEAARVRVASLTTVAERQRADAERAAVEQRTMIASLRDALGERVAELAGVVAALEARDADLAAARAQVASLIAAAGQRQADAEHAATEQQAVVAGLRGALDASSAELDGRAGTLQARDAELAAAQGQIAALTAVAEQLRSEREEVLASWIWKAGQPFRQAHRASRAVITALHLGRPPAA